MGELFKAISGGLARFVFAWMTPSLIALGLFTLYVLPGIAGVWLLAPVTLPSESSGITAALIFSFFVVALSVLFAYASVPIYQVLEGYRLPASLKRRLRRRHVRSFYRLRIAERRFRETGVLAGGYTTDDLRLRYPRNVEDVRPTRLGNALTTMESWSNERYHLDSQTMWSELQGVASDNLRRDMDDGRAPVDFFVSSIAHASLLSVSGIFVGLATPQRQALAIGLLAAATIPVSYRLAVSNTLDWAQSVKALVNLSRTDLAKRLGLEMPATLEAEREMWTGHLYVVELADDADVASYNSYRVSPAGKKSPSWRRLDARRGIGSPAA
jgi:hypothetical protein